MTTTATPQNNLLLAHTVEECYALLAKAAADGNKELLPDELFRLASAYDDGAFGLKQNEVLAGELYRRAAEAGHPLACGRMGRLLTSDEGQISDEGMRFLQKGIDAGEVGCMFQYGCHLLDSDDQHDEAMDYIRQAAWMIYPPALDLMAISLIDAENPTAADRLEAKLYATLSLTYSDDPYVAKMLDRFFTEADCKKNGDLDLKRVIKECAQAGLPLALWERFVDLAADKDGNCRLVSKATHQLAERAAEAGVPDALEFLAMEKVRKADFKEGERLLRRPIEMHMPNAISAQAVITYKGLDGSEPDKGRGIELMEEAASFNIPESCMLLAEMVRIGDLADPYGARADLYTYEALAEE